MEVYFLIVLGFYLLLIVTLWIGWAKAGNWNAGAKPVEPHFISVVVPIRNEETNIYSLLRSLSLLDYLPGKFEIILIDDHSTDNSVDEAKKWNDKMPIRINSLNDSQGKKAALALGISIAQGEVIATTDADCELPPDWLKKINVAFDDKRINMIIGAVAFQNEKKFFNQLQSIEFASVIATGMGLAAMGKPTMCNGANLSFRKKTFEEVGGYAGNEHIASGDDEFLMRKIEDKYPGSVGVLREPVVITRPHVSLRDFLLQRLRWASKWKINSSIFSRLLAVCIFVAQVSWLVLLALTSSNPSLVLLMIIGFKLIIDLCFLSTVSRHLKMNFDPIAFVSLQFLYPIYVLYIGIFSQIGNHQWKGRNI